MPYRIEELSAKGNVAIFRALASDTRARILELLGTRTMNIGELSASLGMAQPSITKHIQLLEEAGLVQSDYLSGAQGMQKRCRRTHDRILVEFGGLPAEKDLVAEVEVPVGMYSSIQVIPTCGLASREKFIGHLDDPLSFQYPDRAHAEILWSGGGSVEYVFPNSLPTPTQITAVDLAVEISSEAPGYNNEYPSDITVWINHVEIGTWCSPGDLGGVRGRLNPSWWQDYLNQYGFLKVWQVDRNGTSIDGVPLSEVKIADLGIKPWQGTRVKIGVKSEAAHQGGFTLFGRGFGNYEQDIVLRIHHETRGGDIPENLKTSPTHA
jgi:predicted transcriptional regulator